MVAAFQTNICVKIEERYCLRLDDGGVHPHVDLLAGPHRDALAVHLRKLVRRVDHDRNITVLKKFTFLEPKP